MPTYALRLLVAWLPSLIIVGMLQLLLQAPVLFVVNHDILCGAFIVVSATAAVVAAVQMGRWRQPLVRRRLTLLVFGATGGLVIPALLLWCAPDTDRMASIVGALGLTCIFAVVCMRARRIDDLFRLDRMVQRMLTGCVTLAILAAAEALAWWIAAAQILPFADGAAIAAVHLFLLTASPLLYRRVRQRVANRLTPRHYNVRVHLARFAAAVGVAHTVAAVQRSIADLLRLTVDPSRFILYLSDKRSGGFVAGPGCERDGVPRILPSHFLVSMRAGRSFYRHRSDDGRSPTWTARWTALGVDVLIPIRTGGTTYAVLALGGKRAGRTYHSGDFALLHAAAGYAALAFANAGVHGQLDELAATLERSVNERMTAERTANRELQSTNDDLQRSVRELRDAYAQLEQNHEFLLRADRLATLGRLTAGIAHEVNTPLSAVQNALKVLTELGHEYAASIDDETVTAADHHEMAQEIADTARAAAEWADKAARFIRGTKTHGRTARDTVAEPFSVSDVVDEARILLVHRLRVANCTLECPPESDGISIVGDRSAFAQVLINLITNALDAYEDAQITNARIVVSVTRTNDTVAIEVRDWAGGIPLQVLPRIFDELFTTKQAGRGTGLGLWISRTIIEKEFGGMLDVMSTPGDGSRFIASIPAVSSIPARSPHTAVSAAA